MDARRTAVIVGASTGIGAALARQLSTDGWRVCLMARRIELLEKLALEIGGDAVVQGIDIAEPEAAAHTFERFLEQLGGVDLVIISAGVGHLNPALEWGAERETLAVNVLGFAAIAQVTMRYFIRRQSGHLVGISSIAALRGSGVAAAYGASKAFQSNYLDGLRNLARKSGFPIAVTEVQPGFVDTAMMKTDQPLPPAIKRLLVASPEVAAAQILRAVRRRAKHAYITKRYGILAFLLKRLPRPG